MFGGGSNSPSGSKTENDSKSDDRKGSPESSPNSKSDNAAVKAAEQALSGEKRSGNGSPPDRNDNGGSTEKKRRSSSMSSKASHLLASAKNTLNFSQVTRSGSDLSAQTPLQKLGKQDPALAVPQGQHNNSAGESVPGPNSTFKVGVWEDRNRKCRRTMEDTHAFLYNFLDTPPPALDAVDDEKLGKRESLTGKETVVESDNGYFAVFDGHAGTFAADWCGKKLHIILEDVIRKNPNTPLPELLDQTFTTVDSQLEKLPLKNSGCTAAIAVLRWEDRVPSDQSATGSQAMAPAVAAAAAAAAAKQKPKSEDDSSQIDKDDKEKEPVASTTDVASTASTDTAQAKLKGVASRQRVLYTANVGDARIILCRNGKALRLSYDHKGSDENEGKRIANAGGLILNNRVNGVLAVTRALGDTYMKDLVTGHPYTTETVIQPDSDEFFIIACDGLWDVCSDQEAVDLVRNVKDPITASKQLVDHALSRFSTDNLSCMIVRFDKAALAQNKQGKEAESDSDASATKVSEVEKIVLDTKQKIAEGTTPAVGVSASNSGRGHEPTAAVESEEFVPTTIDGPVEEEPGQISSDNDSPEVTPNKEKASSLETPKEESGS